MMGYDRTEEGFKMAFDNLKMLLRWHKTPLWLVASKGQYYVSAVKPQKKNIEKGTVANLYNKDLEIIDSIIAE